MSLFPDGRICQRCGGTMEVHVDYHCSRCGWKPGDKVKASDNDIFGVVTTLNHPQAIFDRWVNVLSEFMTEDEARKKATEICKEE